ncbi:ABC transporter permease [Glycomyces sp. NPDC048151]|uniref:ABC transporter permease n=1 Tax=Glycomyces sp. NPDC048151 TaxID=3364002 RepID=UPI003712AAD5
MSTAHATAAADPSARAAGRSRLAAKRVVAPLIVLALVLGGWSLVSYSLAPARRFLLPPPDQVVRQGLFGIEGPNMFDALQRSAIVAGAGLLIAMVLGIVWAVLMSQARWAEHALFPYAVALQCIPTLALVPLIGFWFGFGFSARVLVCVLIALFPIVSNTLFGLKSVDAGLRELFALRRSSRFTVLRKLELPAALPAIFAGIRISAGLAVVGAIVGDFFFKQGAPGIGILIDTYRARLQSPEMFAAVLLASALGVIVFLFFSWLSRWATAHWHGSERL